MSHAEAAIEHIVATLVPENRRLSILPGVVGPAYMMRAENAVYNHIERMAQDYKGGYWEFYELSNGGFYMAPTSPERFTIDAPNGYTVEMSAAAAGIVACLYAFNYLCNYTEMDRHITLYYALRGFAIEHAEWPQICKAID